MSEKKKNKHYYIKMNFLPGDGSPRLLPMDYEITEQSYNELKKLIDSGKPVNQFRVEWYSDDGAVIREVVNFPNNERLYSFCVYVIETSLIELPGGRKKDRILDQSVKDGHVH